jgi:hypothetical protein
MAVQPVQLIPTGEGVLAVWALGAGDTGEWVQLAHKTDKTVHVSGTATTFALQGSNDRVAISTLTDVDNTTAIDQSGPLATKMLVIKQNPVYIRPSLTTGSAVFSIMAR